MLPITATNYIVDFNKSIIINRDAIWEQPFSTTYFLSKIAMAKQDVLTSLISDMDVA